MNLDRLLTRKEAADYLGISPNTLAYWRCRKKPCPPMAKLGNRCLYRKEDLDAFVAANISVHKDNSKQSDQQNPHGHDA